MKKISRNFWNILKFFVKSFVATQLRVYPQFCTSLKWEEERRLPYSFFLWVQQTRVKNNAGAKALFSSTKNLWSASNDLISPTPRKLLVLWLCNCTRIFVQNWRRSSFSIFLPSTEVFWSSGYSDNEIPVSHWRLIVKSCIL